MSFFATIGIVSFNNTILNLLNQKKFCYIINNNSRSENSIKNFINQKSVNIYKDIDKIKDINNQKYDKEIHNNKSIINKLVTKIKEIISVSLSAQILIFPLSMMFFNKLSITFLLSNILVSFLIGIIIILGFIAVIFPFKFLYAILNMLLSILTCIANMFSNISISKIIVVTPRLSSIIIYYIMIIVITCLYRLKTKEQKRRIEKRILSYVGKLKVHIFNGKKKVIIFSIIIVIAIKVISFIPSDLKIHFIDVGQGDSCLIITPKNKTILIDGGGSSKEEFDVGKNTLLPYLLDRRIKKLDYLIVSHFDADHVRFYPIFITRNKSKKCYNRKAI